jgi:hypothetical protein
MSTRAANLGLGTSRRAPAWALSILFIGAVAYLLLFVDAVRKADTELIQALTVAPILIGMTIPIALRYARAEGDPRFAGIIVAAVVAKLLVSGIRFYVAFVVYHGGSDAAQYDAAAKLLAPDLRRFILTPQIGSVVGTGFIKLITGIVYAIFGTSRIGGFLVFAWMGFLGLLLFARAFRIAFPNGDGRRYLLLVLFLPSLVYWPSAMGKDAWMMLTLGLATYGVACMFQRRTSGVIAFVVGLLGMTMVRPHIALLIFIGLVVALLMRRAPTRTYAAPMFRLLGLAALVALGIFLSGRTASFLGQPNLTTDTVAAELSQTEARTGEGGSAFRPVKVNTPLDLVPAFVTVFFRPLPIEAHNAQGLLTSAEGISLIGLMFASRKRLRTIPRLIRTQPYVAFCLGYVFAFVYAFSSFGNFGILARQRVQALPFLLVFLALPTLADLQTVSTAPAGTTSAVPATSAPTRQRPEPTARRRRRRPLPTGFDRKPVPSGLPPPERAGS